jgi:copper chaperone
MEKQTLVVPAISCGHCVGSIKSELFELKGIRSVEGDAEAKTITVAWEAPATLDGIKKALAKINYPAA